MRRSGRTRGDSAGSIVLVQVDQSVEGSMGGEWEWLRHPPVRGGVGSRPWPHPWPRLQWMGWGAAHSPRGLVEWGGEDGWDGAIGEGGTTNTPRVADARGV